MSLIDSSPSSGSSFAKKLLKSLSRKDSIKRLEFKPAEPDSSKMDVIEVNNQKKKKKSLSKRLGKQLSGSFKVSRLHNNLKSFPVRELGLKILRRTCIAPHIICNVSV